MMDENLSQIDEKKPTNIFLDFNTMNKVKQFMKKNNRYNFNETISNLINLGLANLGYTDKEKALEKFEIKIDSIENDIFKIPFNSEKTINQIIKTLCQKSKDTNAHRTDILIESRSKGITPSKTTEILDKLKQKNVIYEPKKDYFKIK